MWPGRLAARVRTSRTRDSRTSGGAKRVMGSRLPWTAQPGLRASSLRRGDAPVEAEDVRAGLSHGGEHGGGVDAEVDDGDAEGLDALDELGGGGEAVLAVVGDGEGADPGVEDLDAVGAGFDLLLRRRRRGRC
jgi:hypothetical protein